MQAVKHELIWLSEVFMLLLEIAAALFIGYVALNLGIMVLAGLFAVITHGWDKKTPPPVLVQAVPTFYPGSSRCDPIL